MVRSAQDLRVPFDYLTYRAILGALWTPILRGILDTRAYGDGFGLVLRLLAAGERYRHRLTAEEIRDHQIRLYRLALTLLDRADRWREYLEAWESLKRAHLTLTYSGGRRVHFLSLLQHRRELIARKLARAQAGGRTGNLVHMPQAGLPAEEIRKRLEWIRSQYILEDRK